MLGEPKEVDVVLESNSYPWKGWWASPSMNGIYGASYLSHFVHRQRSL